MRNISLFFVMTLVMACSHKPTFFNQYKDRQLYIRKSFVTDESTARKFIYNRISFLHQIFTPSTVFLSDVPLVTAECIQENRIGEIYEDSKSILAASILEVDLQGNKGICSSNFKTSRVNSIYLYCKPDNYVLTIQFKYEPDFVKKVREMEFCAI